METTIDLIEMSERKVYSSPQIEVIEVMVEQGFAEGYAGEGDEG